MSMSDVYKSLSAALGRQGTLLELIYRLDGSLRVTLLRGQQRASCLIEDPAHVKPPVLLEACQMLLAEFVNQNLALVNREVACAG